MARHAPPPFLLTAPVASIRHYSGEHSAHAHDHAQILYALEGRMELEVAGRAAFVDAACGMVVPAGVVHGFLASPGARLFVIDAPHDENGVGKVRRVVSGVFLHGGDATVAQKERRRRGRWRRNHEKRD